MIVKLLFKRNFSAILFLLFSSFFVNSQNLLTNGDFETGGNGVGFNINGMGYNLISAPFSGTSNPGDYAFTTNPQPINTGFFITGGDHTSGTGNMMIVDGNTTGGDQRFWRAGNTGGGVCGLTVGYTYTFSYWIKSVATTVTDASTQASIGIQFTNVSSSSLVNGSVLAPLPSNGWQQVVYTFVPSSTCVNIELWNTNTNAVGNDFAVDDFSVLSPPIITNKTISICSGNSFSILPIDGATDYVPAGTTYTWAMPTVVPVSAVTGISAQTTGQVLISQTLNNTTTSPATVTYVVTATPLVGASSTFNIVVTVNPLPTATLGVNTTICPGNNATLTITGTPSSTVTISNGVSNYAANIGIGGTGTFTTPILNVSTTYYLVSVKVFSTQCNQIINGPPVIVTVVPNGCAIVTTGNGVNTLPIDTTICSVGDCRTLNANYSPIASTTSYAVSSIPYCPQSAFENPTWTELTSVAGGVTGDDAYGNSFNFPGLSATTPAFEFCFFGTNYSSIRVGTNGLIAFANPGGFCPWSYTASVPSTAFPLQARNAIYGVYQDTNFGVTPTPPAILSANYNIIGTYPCRKFIVNFSNLPQFSCNNTVGLQTSQIVLYEVSNIIEVYVQRRVPCTGWNGGNGVIGIQNASGTQGYTPPGRNTGAWSAFNEAWRFTPNGPNVPVTFAWQQGATTISTNTSINVCPTTTTTYTAEATYLVCGVPQKAKKTITIDVFPDLTQSPNNITQCSNIFNLTVNNPTILGALEPTDFDISYHTSLSEAQIGLNPISNPTSYIGYNGQVIYTYINDAATGCVHVKSFNLNVSICQATPEPVPDIPICDNLTPYNDGLGIFDLTPQTPITLGTYSPVDYTVTYHTSLYDAQNDINAIANPSAYPNTSNPQTIYIRLEENATPTTYGTTSFQLIVNSVPVITDKAATICSNTAFSITPNNSGTEVVPTGTTYTWAAPTLLGSVTGGSAETVGQTSISQTLVNTSLVPGTATYLVTASFGVAPNVCTDTFNVVVTVNPTPIIGDKTATICSNTAFSITPVHSGAEVVPTGTTYTWAAPILSGSVTGGSAETVGQTLISQTLVNTSLVPGTATYLVTATSGVLPDVCTDTFNIVVTVNPTPIIGDKTATICSNTAFSITPVHSGAEVVPTGTTYTWTAPTLSGSVTGGSAETVGQTSISQTLVNTSLVPGTATYLVTASFGIAPDVCIDTFNVVVTVNPTPIIADKTATICSNTAFSITPVHSGTEVVPTGTTYTWTAPTLSGLVTGGSAETIGQTSISQTLVNTSSAPATATYLVTASSGVAPNVCTDTFNVVVTVNPTPIIADKTATICSNTAFSITPVHSGTEVVPTGVTYTWTAPTLSGSVTGGSAETVGQTSISQTLVNTSLVPGTATYLVTASFGVAPDVCTDTFNVVVTVNPTPIIADKTATICSNTAFSITPVHSGAEVVPTGTTYTWAAPTLSGSVTGGSAEVVGQTSISQTLVNTSSTPATATYLVTASSGVAPNVCTDTFNVVVTINPLPTASISGSTSVCLNATSPLITFTGGSGTAPYTFTYTDSLGSHNINSIGNTATISQSTSVAGSFTYTLVSVIDANGCSQLQTGSSTITVISAPVINTPTDYVICDNGVDNNGLACFDLSTKNSEITTASGVTITYHETATDALTGGAALSTSYCNITPWTQTIHVRVFDPLAPTCASVTSFNLIVNPLPIANPVIEDYVQCDYTTPGDMVEVFDLSTKTVEIANGQTNVTVSYYATQAEAIAHVLATELPNLYTSGSSQVWINIRNNTTGCSSVSSFNLVVNPLPIAVAPNDMSGCSNGASNQSYFNLSLNNPVVTASIPGTIVTYHNTLLEAQNGTPVISSTNYLGTDGEIVYIRVENAATGCYKTTLITLHVTQGPVATTPSPLHYCDPNNDGFGGFNLASTINQIAGGSLPLGVSVTFHETETDALLGSSALASPYSNINPWTQTIHVRVYYTLTGCANYVQLQLIVDPTPEATEPDDYHLCDNDIDGYTMFDLTSITPEVLGTIDGTQNTVTYYTSLAAAQAGTPAIIGTASFTNTTPNTQTIWVRVENNTTGCFDIVTLQLVVDPLPSSMQPAYPQYSLCDNSAPVGYEIFDLQSKVTTILMGQTGMSVKFYPSLLAAQSNTNEIINLNYPNSTIYVQTLGIRITNETTGCFVISTMDIRVEPLPTPIVPTTPYTLCDASDNDGITSFDLDSLTPSIGVNGLYTITYHETIQNAQLGILALTSPYQNINNSWTHTIYGAAVNPVTGCRTVFPIVLQVNPSPIMPTLNDLTLCDTVGNSQNGITTFDLTLQTPIILAAQTVLPTSNYLVTYYTTLANAQAQTSNIVNTSTYTNTTNPQTIWVVVKNTITGCFQIGSFQLKVNAPLALTAPTQLSVCDDDALPNNLHTAFNLTVKNDEITGIVGSTGYTVNYYNNFTAPLPTNGVVPSSCVLITPNTSYVNGPPAVETLLVQVINNTTGCVSFTTLTIRVLPVPKPNYNPPVLTPQCENAIGSGVQTFDVTTNATIIANGDPDVTLHYFNTLADAQSFPFVNEITAPTTALIGDASLGTANPRPVNQLQYVYVVVSSSLFTEYTGQNCNVIVQQPYIINPLPVAVAIPTQQICETDTTGPGVGFESFDLTSYNSLILAGNATTPVSTYAVTFYTDAAHLNPIATPTAYTNTSNPQTIYVGVTSNNTYTDPITGIVHTTSCTSYASFDIRVNPKPTITVPTLPLSVCDALGAANDGYTPFDLTTLVNGILNGQSATDFAVTFYDSQYNPGATPPLLPTAIASPSTYLAYTHTIWVAVTNNITGCYITGSFEVVVEQKPEPEIFITEDAATICVDYVTDDVIRPLTLQIQNNTVYLNPTNATQAFTYQWFEDGVAIPGATNATYTINTAHPLNSIDFSDFTVQMTNPTTLACGSTSAPFNVLQSGPAVIPTGESGYTVTNAFSENQIITVSVDGYGTYVYSLDNGPRQTSPVFENVGLGEHIITVWDTEGGLDYSCDELIINQVQTTDYPHYFTPNGDGINDTWNIVGLKQADAKIYIFDRFGKLIKQISAEGNGWDGTFNGSQLPSTDYWFTVDYKESDILKQFKAHFSLKR